MPHTKADRTARIARDSMPDYQLDQTLLYPVLAALPPPWPGAPVAWRYARLRRVINEIAAFSPFNLMDAMRAGNLVIYRRTAAHLVRESLAHEVPPQIAARMRLMEAQMLRAVRQLERTLQRRPRRALPPGSPPASDAFDLAELDTIWCRDRTRRRRSARCQRPRMKRRTPGRQRPQVRCRIGSASPGAVLIRRSTTPAASVGAGPIRNPSSGTPAARPEGGAVPQPAGSHAGGWRRSWTVAARRPEPDSALPGPNALHRENAAPSAAPAPRANFASPLINPLDHETAPPAAELRAAEMVPHRGRWRRDSLGRVRRCPEPMP
jgi:hypothetical protein